MRRTYYVAKVRGKKELYAALGNETGMGREIIDVNLDRAERSGSPAGLMYGFLGGHYTGYVPIKIQQTTFYKKTRVRWPDPDKVFDR